MKEVYVLKADGTKELFIQDKLRESLTRAGAESPIIEKIVEHIDKEIMSDMSTADIYKRAFDLLKKEHRHVAARYSLKRALIELGPTGFPFEKFIGELFRMKGYEVEVGKVMQGHCVQHEVDLVAWNDKELILGEIKFHNELGYKSDLKVALYVKSRMDDLRAAGSHFIGGKPRTMTTGILLTNTKFSSGAIQYGECAGLQMIGWNYPAKNNLQDLIEGSGLHPLTCLTSLNEDNKAGLFKKGVVLCKSIKDDPSMLREIGMTVDKAAAAHEEASRMC